ncbi:MAG: NADH:ubiquinone reductase (Na(+)-transporting) subunit C [Gammaproteobacteria bacterium]|nr:NADH:ubiquinone reductase (Na(+)-transporting) subunit C [Gammaproteobacteria bacterium]
MPDKKPIDRDSMSNTLLVAVSLSLVCSVFVASAAVVLKPVQERNQELYRQRIILEVAGLMHKDADVAALFANIESEQVALTDGSSAEVYRVITDGRLEQVILPISGAGLWSTMYGYLSVAPDGNTIKGIRFYEHGETPGLGDQIDKPDWRAAWAGKHIYAVDREPQIEVVRGFADSSSTASLYQVDGLAGATLTGNGVTRLVRRWTGTDGFGPFLASIAVTEDDET